MLLEVDMKFKKYFVSNQRKRTLNRHKMRLANRRHSQFASDQFHSATVIMEPIKFLEHNS
mgnify:CR=1 FL=1